MVRPGAESCFATRSFRYGHLRLVQAEVEATLQRILAHKVGTHSTPFGSSAAHTYNVAERPAWSAGAGSPGHCHRGCQRRGATINLRGTRFVASLVYCKQSCSLGCSNAQNSSGTRDLQASLTDQYATLFSQVASLARNMVRDLDPTVSGP